MKIVLSWLVAAVAGASLYALPAGEAQAETRFHFRWMLAEHFPPPPPRRYYYYYPEPPYSDFYGYEDPYDDEFRYYPYGEDYYEPPPRKRSKRSTARTAPEDIEPVPLPKKKKKPEATAATESESTSGKDSTKKPATGQASVSCDKAKSIITAYGFGNVETKSCSGKEYSFAAVRGGKSFSVKVSAANGELTEVKRQ
jgi:hypothetical protein